MVWPAVIAAGGAIAGGLLANASNARQASNQMDFQEQMSSTAHQREVADLAAAGLNPILSATGGHGASTPGGAQAQMQDVIGPGVSSAVSAQRTKQDIRESEERENAARTQAGLNTATRDLAEQNREKVEAETDAQRMINKYQPFNIVLDLENKQASRDLTSSQERLSRQQFQTESQRSFREHYMATSAKNEADASRYESDIREALRTIYQSDAKGRALEGSFDETKAGEILRWIRRFSESIGGGGAKSLLPHNRR